MGRIDKSIVGDAEDAGEDLRFRENPAIEGGTSPKPVFVKPKTMIASIRLPEDVLRDMAPIDLPDKADRDMSVFNDFLASWDRKVRREAGRPNAFTRVLADEMSEMKGDLKQIGETYWLFFGEKYWRKFADWPWWRQVVELMVFRPARSAGHRARRFLWLFKREEKV